MCGRTERPGLFAQHVLNRMNVACGHELNAEDALVAHVTILIGKQHGDVEGRELVDLDVLRILGQIGSECRGGQEGRQNIGGELRHDHRSCNRAAAAGPALGVDVAHSGAGDLTRCTETVMVVSSASCFDMRAELPAPLCEALATSSMTFRLDPV